MPREVEDMNGELEAVGDEWRLRFTRELPHEPAKVWRAITEADHLRAWFPQRIVGDWKVGAPLRFEGESGSFEGRVLRFEPETILEFLWGTDVIRVEVAPNQDGHRTTLTLLDTFAPLGKAARDAAGWHTCLDFLAHHLAAKPAPWESRRRWEEVHPRYVDKFGPQAATLGPPA
jgi:uncharacterized protein YndB with AHSA1/START domain